MQRVSGELKFFIENKGYGFIQRDDGGDDMFVHVSALHDAGIHEPQKGERLSFIESQFKGRPVAAEVERA